MNLSRGIRLTATCLVTVFLTVGGTSLAEAADFTSTGPITDPAGYPGPNDGPSAPYPSTIDVSGLSGRISDVNVTLTNVTHVCAADLSILLVGPQGQQLTLAPGDALDCSGASRTWTFDDAAPGPLPPCCNTPSGSYQPTSNPSLMPSPAPPPPYGGSLAEAFGGIDPNGAWKLYVDDTCDCGEGGTIASWTLSIEAGAAAKQCADGKDNDGDGKSDLLEDAGCSTAGDDDERDPQARPPVEFTNPSGISVPAETDGGPLAPYPSTIAVAGLDGTVGDVNVTLTGIAKDCMQNLDVLLAGPQGQRLWLAADTGGCALDLSGVPPPRTYTFDDAAPQPLVRTPVWTQETGDAPPSGAYKPTAFEFSLAAPAPPPPYTRTLAQAFNGTDPNGTWKLYVKADSSLPYGVSIDSWKLSITGGPPTPATQCTDGKDNDSDGKTDFPADGGCSSATDNSEVGPSKAGPPAGPGPSGTTPAATCPAGSSAGVKCKTAGSQQIITGTSGNDTIVGTAGRDVINCGGGDDVVNAGAGDDVINCGAGDDTVSAGAGNDIVHGNADDDEINGEDGNDRLFGDTGKDLITGGDGKDRIYGGAGADDLSGNDAADRIQGGSGNDGLKGNAGNDRLSGGSGKDRLLGGSGRDVLKGNAGNDRLSGGSGKDRLLGGSGRDVLKGGPGLDRLRGGPGKDKQKQ